MIKPLIWENDILKLIDQRKLPLIEEYVDVTDLEECFDSIKDMVVRGAPLIGFTALWGMVLDIKNNPSYRLKDIVKSAFAINELIKVSVSTKLLLSPPYTLVP